MTIEIGGYRFDSWPAGMFLLCVLLVFLRHRQRSLSYLFCFSMFWIYVLCAIDRLFFPLVLSGAFADAARQLPFGSGYGPQIQLAPFWFGPDPETTSLVKTSLLNLLVTFPFGFGLPFLTLIRVRQHWWLPIVVGIGIESMQFVFSLLIGYLYRVIDIIDVIWNALGVVIGYSLFRLCAQLYIAATHQFGLKHRGMTAYIYSVATDKERS